MSKRRTNGGLRPRERERGDVWLAISLGEKERAERTGPISN